VLTAFVDGSVDPISGASAETHLMGCAGCRDTVKRLSEPVFLDSVWTRVRREVEAPPVSLLERLLLRSGVSETTARLLATVPAMQGAWFFGVVLATVFAALADSVDTRAGLTAFLTIAPLAPLVGVALSFGGDADPAHELVVTSPYSSLRLLMLRTGGVLAAAVPVAVVVGVSLPGPSWLAVAWLAPAAACVSLALALGPYLGYTASAAALAGTWAVAVAGTARVDSLETLLGPAAQIGFLVLALAGALVVIVHHGPSGHVWRNT
jgi:hypothetical protein